MLIGEALEIVAQRHPDRPAIVFDDEGRSISYGELRERSHRLANALVKLAQTGDRVAILSQNRPEYIEAYWGVTAAGLCLNLLNYRLTPPELIGIVNDAEPAVALVESEYLETMRAIRAATPSLKLLVVIGAAELQPGEMAYEALLQGAEATAPDWQVDDRALALLIYTSGTTGVPKGAMLSQAGIMHASHSWLIHIAKPMSTVGVSLMPFPLCHMAGIGAIIDLSIGATVVLQRSFDPVAVMTAISRYKVMRIPFAPTMLNMVLRHPRAPEFDLSSLRLISYGSAAMPIELLKLALERLPGADFAQGFGMTETSGNAMCLDPEDHRLALAGRAELLATAGRPSSYVGVRLVDEQVRDVAPGTVGEIVIKAPSVMMGYWRRDEANAEAFTDGWFHTGDMGVATPDGYIAIVDRKKDMIISGGENVYSREVEEIIYRHSGVHEVAVIGLPDPMWGEVVCAVIVPTTAGAVTAEEIDTLCRDNLAGYKKPRRVIFREELPHTASGKIQKRELRRVILAEQSPD